MNTAGVWASLWKAIGLVSVASIIFACALTRARWQWPSLAVRVLTTIFILVGLVFSSGLVSFFVQPSILLAQSHDVWVHPSLIMFWIPAIVGAVAGSIYSVYLRQRDSGRVA